MNLAEKNKHWSSKCVKIEVDQSFLLVADSE